MTTKSCFEQVLETSSGGSFPSPEENYNLTVKSFGIA